MRTSICKFINCLILDLQLFLVHNNSTIYAAHDTLTFEDKVTSTGGYFNEYAPLDPRHGNASTPPTFPANEPASQTPREDPLGISPSQFDKTDTNQNNDSYREIIERPALGQSDPLTDLEYLL